MRKIESKYSGGDITSKTGTGFTSITKGDVTSKTKFDVTSKADVSAEREGFLTTARRNASLIFSKYL
jgi:hypothetical protein